MTPAPGPSPERSAVLPGEGQRRQTLRTALLSLLLASLLPLVLVAAAFLWMQWDMQRTAAMEGLRQRVQTLTLAVERELGVNLAILETLAASPEIDDRNWAKFHAVAEAAIRSRPSNWIVLVAPSGQEVINTRVPFGVPLPNLLEIYSRQREIEWEGRRLPSFDARVFEPMRSGRPIVSNLAFGPVIKKAVLGVAVPVLRNGKPAYTLSMGFSPDDLASLLAREQSSGTVLTGIVDGNGRIVARNVDSAKFLGLRASPPFDQATGLQAAGMGEAASLDGEPVIYAYQRLSLSDWRVTAAIPRQELLAPAYRTFIPWLMATLLLVGVGIHLAHRLQRYLVVPLMALARSADALQRGQTPPMPATRIQEVEILTQALQQAALREQARREELARRLASEAQAKARAQELADSLRESEERFRLLADNMAQLAWMADGSSSIFWYNERWFDYTGTTAADMQRQGWRPLLPADQAERVTEKLSRCFQTGEVWDDTFPLRGAAGSYRWFLSRALPVRDAQGRVLRWFGTHTDVTEQLEAEAEVRALSADLELRVRERTASLEEKSRELEAVNRELEMFSYSVSHDLRAPLRCIDGFSRILLESHAGQLDEQGRDRLQRMLAASRRMGQLIDDILTLSRLSRGEMRRETVDLAALAHAVAEELQANEPRRNVTFIIQEDVSAVGDGRLLRVVLENLLGNAWKYTSHHPRARIEFGTEQGDGGTTVYFVRDDGAGFDMAYAGKLFGAFQRLHAQADFPGTGVGLTSVQRIIHRHGGEVWAEGTVEAGATFRFTLPGKTIAE